METPPHHDVETNDLQEFRENFGQFWNRYGSPLLLAVLLVLVVIVGYRFWNSRQATQRNAAWADLSMTTSAEGYRALASEYDVGAVPALATLRGADLFLQQAVNPPDPQPTTETTPGEEQPAVAASQMSPEEALETAAAMYRELLEQDTQPIYRIHALMGLANVAETRREWDQARTYWEQALKLSEGQYSFITALVQRRLSLLPRIQEPVVYGPATPEAPAPTAQQPQPPMQLPEPIMPPSPIQPQPQPQPRNDQAPVQPAPAELPAGADEASRDALRQQLGP